MQFFMILSPIFMILLGCMQICVEFKIKWIVNNFTFMNTLLGKGFFMLLYELSHMQPLISHVLYAKSSGF
jgi:hypothetical protein